MRHDHRPNLEEIRKGRACSYQPLGDQLDAISKMAVALQAQGLFLPPETIAWIEHCKSVKTRFPI